MMRLIVLSLMGCGPRIAVGPSLAEKAGADPRIVVEAATSGRAVLQASYPGGARYDPPGREGLGWLAAQVRWRGGGETWPADRLRWAPFVEDVTVDVDVGRDRVSVTWECPEHLVGPACRASWRP